MTQLSCVLGGWGSPRTKQPQRVVSTLGMSHAECCLCVLALFHSVIGFLGVFAALPCKYATLFVLVSLRDVGSILLIRRAAMCQERTVQQFRPIYLVAFTGCIFPWSAQTLAAMVRVAAA